MRYTHACSAVSGLVIALVASTVQADNAELDQLEQKLEKQLEQQLEQQQRDIDAMRARLDKMNKGNNSGISDGSSARLSGFVSSDMIYDFKRVDPAYEATLRPTTIPTQPDVFGEDGKFIFSVKQTQLAFKSETSTAMGKATGWIEFDLFGTGNNAGETTFNIRHAWFTLGRWGAGQTWSNFMDISTWPNVVDWWGPSGMPLNRNPQLRYTVPMGDSSFAVALEQQNASFNVGIFGEIAPSLVQGVQPKVELPDLNAHYRHVEDWGHVQVAGTLRKLVYEQINTPSGGIEGDETGWGLHVSGILNTFGKDQLKYSLVHGAGIATYINDGGGSNLIPAEGGGVEAQESTGGLLYYDHYWNSKWSSSIGVSVNDMKTNSRQSANEIDKVTYTSTNVIFRPDPALLAGMEFLYGERENVGGGFGTDFRVQFAFRYLFDHSLI